MEGEGGGSNRSEAAGIPDDGVFVGSSRRKDGCTMQCLEILEAWSINKWKEPGTRRQERRVDAGPSLHRVGLVRLEG